MSERIEVEGKWKGRSRCILSGEGASRASLLAQIQAKERGAGSKCGQRP
jgi:hypothetical protein